MVCVVTAFSVIILVICFPSVKIHTALVIVQCMLKMFWKWLPDTVELSVQRDTDKPLQYDIYEFSAFMSVINRKIE